MVGTPSPRISSEDPGDLQAIRSDRNTMEHVEQLIVKEKERRIVSGFKEFQKELKRRRVTFSVLSARKQSVPDSRLEHELKYRSASNIAVDIERVSINQGH